MQKIAGTGLIAPRANAARPFRVDPHRHQIAVPMEDTMHSNPDAYIAALKRERAQYEADGRKDRAAEVTAEIKHTHGRQAGVRRTIARRHGRRPGRAFTAKGGPAGRTRGNVVAHRRRRPSTR
jgi:hypothetical protein